MFSRVAKRVRRQSTQVGAPLAAPEVPSGPPREVVDCAPDLLRWCDFETPFPSVAFGGYLKYYRTRESTDFLASLSSSSPSSSRIPATPLFDSELPSIQPSTSPFDVKPMTPQLKIPRKARCYSFSQVANDKIPTLSRWKRATYILTPDMPQFNTTTTTATTALDLIARPSLDTSRSSSSNESTTDSDPPPSLSPDSVSFSEITLRSSDTTPTLCYPQTPTMTYNNDDDDNIFLMDSQKKRFSGIEIGLQRPDSTLSFWTAKSEFSDKFP